MNKHRHTLTLIRHAKSSWDQPLSDFDRPLKRRGINDAKALGEWLAANRIAFDCFVSSPAQRALETAELIIAEMKPNAPELITDQEIYLASSSKLLKIISQFDEHCGNVALVGHNPGISDLASRLLPTPLDDGLRTCACLRIGFEIDSWQEILSTKGKLQFFRDPKMQAPIWNHQESS